MLHSIILTFLFFCSRQFGSNEDENASQETFNKIRKIFDERWGENGQS